MVPQNSPITRRPQRPPGLKMQELVAATGVPKSTILHYLNQGLLPPPVKTSRNMAYYDPRCILRIRYIQHLKRRHRLSLSEIKEMLDAKGDEADLSVLMDLKHIIFGKTEQEDLLDLDAFCEATALERGQVRELMKAGLLLPL